MTEDTIPKRDKKKLIANSLVIITTLIDKIPPTLRFPGGGVTPLWKRGARGDFQMSIQF
jgi:hypothetical protein